MRVGLGYDIHQMVEGRKLILGGVEIKHDKGSKGHSDGAGRAAPHDAAPDPPRRKNPSAPRWWSAARVRRRPTVPSGVDATADGAPWFC